MDSPNLYDNNEVGIIIPPYRRKVRHTEVIFPWFTQPVQGWVEST